LADLRAPTRTARLLRPLLARAVTPGTPISALRLVPDSPPSTRVTVSAPGPGSTGRSHNWGRRKTPSFRQTLPNFTETRLSRRSAAAIYSNSPHATSTDRSFTASAIRHRFSTKFSRDRSGTAALTWITPTILATTGPAAQQVPRRSAILIESAMAHPGIPRTPQKDAARQRWKAAAAQAFSTVSQLTDIHRLAHALCGRSVSAPCSSLQLLSLALDFTASSRATIRKPDHLYSSRGQATPSLAGFRREAFERAASRREG